MKPVTKACLAILLVLPMFGACGLRGGLARPDPIFKSVSTVEDVMEDEAEAEAPAPEPETGPRLNDLGGEIPDAAPVEPVEEAPMNDAGNG